MSKVVGIDLGTTNSVVAVLEANRPEIIPNAEGRKTTPSVIYFADGGEIVVGELAQRQRITAPKRVVHSVKRFMGCRWDEVTDRLEGIAYEVQPDAEGMVTVRVGSRPYRPEDISAQVLLKMKATAEAFVNEPIENAVITVPAHFNDSQRQATKLAAEKAGLRALRLVNEPTAAALAYGLAKRERSKVAVFDFGGGTFDVTILEIDGDIFEVKSTGGDTFLGGDNINHILIEWIAERIREATGLDPRPDPQALQRISETAEKVKCELSTLSKTMISLPFIVSDETGPKHYSGEITREEFETLIEPILARLRPPCETAMADARIKPENLANIIMVGGSTRIPAVRALAREIFRREPDVSINPDEVVAAGAAIQAGIMTGDLEEVLLLDVVPLSLGIELTNDVFSVLVPRNANVPTTVRRKFTTVADNQDTVKIHVLQGERKRASQNRSLSHFRLKGIAPAPKEIPEIQVSFAIDANGILTVSAEDLTSGRAEEVKIESYLPGAEAEVERAIGAAAEHAEEDRLFMQKAAVRRRLEEMESSMEVIRHGGPLGGDLEQRIKEAFFKLEVALNQDQWDLIEEAERNAKSVFLEASAIHAMRIGKESDVVFEVADVNKPQERA